MKGNVIGFDPDTNTGAISGHDGNRYDFVRQDWRGPAPPRRGDLVDFQAVDQRANEIYLVEPAYVAPSFANFYFSASGRISRSQYWLRFILPYVVIVFVLQAITAASGTGSALNMTMTLVSGLFGLVVVWPSIAIVIKRIHDRNKSGWYLLYLLVPSCLFVGLACAWLGAAIFAGEVDPDAVAIPPLGVLGALTIIAGLVLFAIEIWFFVEFGCLRGTIGANRFGPDPVR